jgi:Helix-turn-helix domain of transposase family ISL3
LLAILLLAGKFSGFDTAVALAGDGSRFAVPAHSGEHPVHDTVTKTYRHLNFFQHECELEVRVPRVKLPDGKVVQVSPPWAGKVSGFTLLFEAFVLLLCREMPFSAVARLTGVSVHRAMALADRYVNAAVAAADFSEVRRLAIEETSPFLLRFLVRRGVLNHRHDVFFTSDDEFLATDLDLSTAVLPEEHPIAHFEIHGSDLAVIENLALANGHDAALRRFLTCRVGNQDAAWGMTLALVTTRS